MIHLNGRESAMGASTSPNVPKGMMILRNHGLKLIDLIISLHGKRSMKIVHPLDFTTGVHGDVTKSEASILESLNLKIS